MVLTKMTDIFDNTILCNKCDRKMERAEVEKNGFILRVLQCVKCGTVIVHPEDKIEYEKFAGLRNKVFKVKLRLVGNSYAVSIPKEIVDFMQEQEERFNDMVRLSFEQFGRLSLLFNEEHEKEMEHRRRVK